MLKIPNIQDAINDAIAKKNLSQYVEYVQYLAHDTPAPADCTHVLSIASATSGEKVEFAIKAKGFYAAIADVALKVI